MTPEKAQELRDKATPGPWHVHTRDRHIDGETETWLYVGDTPASPVDHQLMSTAPELAALVAGLRYEYAVEIKHGDGWITSRHHTPTIETAKEIAARYKRTDTRIVRRLATQPEVVE